MNFPFPYTTYVESLLRPFFSNTFIFVYLVYYFVYSGLQLLSIQFLCTYKKQDENKNIEKTFKL